MPDRAARICCLDLDTFFVSVERLFDPSLVGEPVVVGASPGQRGVVTAASYEVRAFGVHAGMPASEARRLAPHAIFVPGRHGVYGKKAAEVKTILQRFTPVVRTASIDEFFLDFRGCERLWALPGDTDPDHTIRRTATRMRVAIQAETGLPASAGIGATRPIAKMASGRAKPAGVWMVPLGGEWDFVVDLPVRKYPGIGPVAESKLLAAGIERLGQLLSLPPGPLRSRFGGLARTVERGVHGDTPRSLESDRPAFREHDPVGSLGGSISNERTFHADLDDRTRVRAQLRAIVERVGWRIRQRGIRARTLTLKLRYADFQTLTRSRTIPPTSDESVLRRTATALLETHWTRPMGLRLLGLGLSNLVAPEHQLALPFQAAPRPAPGSAIDAVRDKFGYDAIRVGAVKGSSRWRS